MPVKTIDLSALLERRVRTIEVQVSDDPGDVLSLTYKPDALTMKLRAAMSAVPDENGEEAMAMLLDSLVCGWSLTVNARPYPVNRENLEALGLPLMGVLAVAVRQDFDRNVTLGKQTPTEPLPDSHGT